MCRSLRRLFLVISVTWLPLAVSAADAGSDWWDGLNVRDLQGAQLHPRGRWIVVVFLSPECPVANADIPVLNALAGEFAPKGVSFVGAYADPNLELPALREHASAYRVAFETADDRRQRLVHATGATYTPETFVFSADGSLLYRGRIDDRVESLDAARPAATRQDLREVLDALVAGRSGPFPSQPGFGCTIPQRVKP